MLNVVLLFEADTPWTDCSRLDGHAKYVYKQPMTGWQRFINRLGVYLHPCLQSRHGSCPESTGSQCIYASVPAEWHARTPPTQTQHCFQIHM